jgi:predicted nucleic acid-binding protein
LKYFFDTSVLAKVYHQEEGTPEVLKIYAGEHKIYISELARIESHSAVYRKYREKEIKKKTLNLLIDKFTADLDEKYEILYFSPSVIEQAVDILSKYGESRSIKTLDSLQLSFFKFYCEEDCFVSSDLKLIDIAKKEKLTTLSI